MGNSVTLKTVAGAAGVSEATVSYVLNGRAEKVGIPPATRDRVLEEARRVGYKPNTVARDLALGHLPGSGQMPVVGCSVDMLLSEGLNAQSSLPLTTEQLNNLSTIISAAGYRLIPVASIGELTRLSPEGLVGVVYKLPQEVAPSPLPVTVVAPVVTTPVSVPAATPPPVITSLQAPSPVVVPVIPLPVPTPGVTPVASVTPVAVPDPVMMAAEPVSDPVVLVVADESVTPPAFDPVAPAETGSQEPEFVMPTHSPQPSPLKGEGVAGEAGELVVEEPIPVGPELTSEPTLPVAEPVVVPKVEPEVVAPVSELEFVMPTPSPQPSPLEGEGVALVVETPAPVEPEPIPVPVQPIPESVTVTEVEPEVVAPVSEAEFVMPTPSPQPSPLPPSPRLRRTGEGEGVVSEAAELVVDPTILENTNT